MTQDGFGDNADAVTRKIEPRQSWLARLFRFKPSRRYLCLQMSRRRARQEVAILLREWRKWGIRDVNTGDCHREEAAGLNLLVATSQPLETAN